VTPESPRLRRDRPLRKRPKSMRERCLEEKKKRGGARGRLGSTHARLKFKTEEKNSRTCGRETKVA